MTTLFDRGGSTYPRIVSGPVAPSPDVEDAVWLNTTENSWYIAEGGAWVPINSVSAPGGSLPPADGKPYLMVNGNWVDVSANLINPDDL